MALVKRPEPLLSGQPVRRAVIHFLSDDIPAGRFCRLATPVGPAFRIAIISGLLQYLLKDLAPAGRRNILLTCPHDGGPHAPAGVRGQHHFVMRRPAQRIPFLIERISECGQK